jgi:Domain of unknown function (DUF4326)
MVAVNLRTHACDVRVDRKTRWGNPFPMRQESDRPRVIAQHKAWLWGEIRAGRVSIPDLAALHGCTLGCHCAPRACHADTLTAAAAWAHGLVAGVGLDAAIAMGGAVGQWATRHQASLRLA